MRIKHETYSAIFHLVYLALATNALLLIGCAPLILGLVVTDPTRSWPLLALVAPLCAPAVVAAFAVLGGGARSGRAGGARSGKLPDLGDRGGVVRKFGRVWRASWRRAMSLGAMATTALVVLGVDIAWAFGQPIGAVMIPVLVMLMVLVVATGLLALVTLAERPTARLRDVLRYSAYLAVRRWYLTAVSLLVLGLLGALFASRPALAIGLAASPLLYVVWANSRFSLRPALDN
ncbi:MAG TPA: hypothetical protein VFC19_10105 [Candidatus Limnocylindrales bacterium]|nr:hypothetical protein [Candidatus Limnocylindrales bacterium]